MAKRRKTLPPVPRKSESKSLLDAIKEIVETGEGVRGDPLDRKLTLRDLIDSGIAVLKRGAVGGTSGGVGPGVEPPPPNLATPPPPEGLAASGSFDGRIFLTWDIPDALYGNHAYTNIYRSSDDNFANAVLDGRDSGVVYTDYARNDAVSPADPTHLQGYYYWITFTSDAGVEGPPNAAAGTYAEPLPDVGYLLETLTGNLDEAPATLGAPDETLILHAERFAIRTGPSDSPVYPLVIADVGGVPTVVLDTAIIRDASIQEGQLGPITVGKLEDDAGQPITTIGGLIRADAIDADNLSVLEAATFYGDVYSGNFVEGSAGWKILQNGTVQFNEGLFNGTVEFQNVTGAGALASKDSADYGTDISGTKPPADADKTSNNTAADTASVAGTAASTVRDNAAAGASSAAKVSDWTRPNTTLINGNKIYTGDAYVDTLQLKGQAVTIPAGTYGADYVYIYDSWANMARVVFTSSGAPVFVHASGSYNVSSNNAIEIRIARDTVSIYDPLGVAGSALWASGVMHTPPAGSRAFALQARRYVGSGSCRMRRRSIFCIETKR